VATPAIDIAHDIIEHLRSHHFPAGKAFYVDAFHFQRVKEAFHTGIVVTAAFALMLPHGLWRFSKV